MGIIKLHNTKLCLGVYRTINCQTNDNLINIVNPKIDRMLPLVPRVESLIKQVELLSLQLTAKFETLPKDFRTPDTKEISQQLKRTAEAAIVTASTTIVGGKDGQQSLFSSSGELSENLRKRKIEEWFSHLTVSHDEKGPEYDTLSELTPDDSVSRVGFIVNKRSQQSNEAGMPWPSSDAGESAGTPTSMNAGRKDSIDNPLEDELAHSSHNQNPPRSRDILSKSKENEISSDSASENTLTEYRADKVDTPYDKKSVEKLLAVLDTNPEVEEWNADDLILNLTEMQIGQGVKSSYNIVGTLLYLLEKGANVNALDAESNTPLHHASETGNTAVVQVLVERKADFNRENKVGWTALHVATSKGRTLAVEILLKAGAPFNVKSVGYWTSLHLASWKGHVGAVEALLKAGASIEARDYRDWTPLIWASSEGHVGVVETLLRAGASIDARTRMGWTSLFLASSMGYLEVVKTLLKADASIDARDSDGCTPLIKASFEKQFDVAEMLLKAGASINARDDWGWTALIWASWHGHVGLVEKLLKAGAALNWEMEPGETALRYSAERGHKQTTELLLTAGADPRVRDIYGNTVLHRMLRRSGCSGYYSGCGCGFCTGTTRLEDMLKLLCENGADPYAKDHAGRPALSLIYRRAFSSTGQQEVLDKVLKECGVKIDFDSDWERDNLIMQKYETEC